MSKESKTTIEVTGTLMDHLKDLKPGQVHRLADKDGRMYAILDWEDFEHILEQGCMATMPST